MSRTRIDRWSARHSLTKEIDRLTLTWLTIAATGRELPFKLPYGFVCFPSCPSLFLALSLSNTAAAVPWSLIHFTTKFVYCGVQSNANTIIYTFLHKWDLLARCHVSPIRYRVEMRFSTTRSRRCCQVSRYGFTSEQSCVGKLMTEAVYKGILIQLVSWSKIQNGVKFNLFNLLIVFTNSTIFIHF